MSPASYQTAPPRDVSFRCLDPGPILRSRCLLWQRTDLQACYLENLTTCADTHIRGGRSGPYNCESKHLLRLERAGNGTRTRDPNLGKVVLYQLSYSRVGRFPVARVIGTRCRASKLGQVSRRPFSAPGSGGEGNRTPDLLNAIQALSQLSYTPGNPRRRSSPDRNREGYPRVVSKSRKLLWQKSQRPVSCSASSA